MFGHNGFRWRGLSGDEVALAGRGTSGSEGKRRRSFGLAALAVGEMSASVASQLLFSPAAGAQVLRALPASPGPPRKYFRANKFHS